MHYIIVSCANVTYNPKGRFVKKVSIQPLFLLQNWVPSSVVLACDRTSTISYTVEPPRKGHFGTNINSSGLSPL